ncbi:DUF262 domain-containing protein [Nocardia sp. NPDC049737]|uniref:GmrSD restriction endonuclease domain-containing protein n=1 Tax=Nocardia sp. NPDC049737 TaxID=3154358 RepID=UPI0034326E9E
MDDWAQPTFTIEKGAYLVSDFIGWNDGGSLELSPDFQRGSVWSRAAKAHLIDTILMGYPIPPIHIRVVNRGRTGPAREIIDGQQRLTAILEYVDDKFSMPRPRNTSTPLPPWAGQKYSQLDSEFQDRIISYSLRTEQYTGNTPDEVIYEVFSRINMHSVPLNSQELRNGRYFGEFKQSAQHLAASNKSVWTALKLFSSQAIARMQDVEFASELLILQIAGMQDKKGSVDVFYKRYEEDFPSRLENETKFQDVLDTIRSSFGELIPTTKFQRTPLFYSLWAVIYHRMIGIAHQTYPTSVSQTELPPTPRAPLDRDAIARVQRAILELSNALQSGSGDSEDLDEEAMDDDSPLSTTGFVEGTLGQTDNIRPRLLRFHGLWDAAELSR